MIVVGLGGNMGGEVAVRSRFVAARAALYELGTVRWSKLYRTAAIGPAQPDYLNAAVGVRWGDAQPGEVLATVLEIERLLGRDRRAEERWGPRAIDLDILWWATPSGAVADGRRSRREVVLGSRVVRQPDFEVPHPRLRERRFALLPLLDLIFDSELVAAEATLHAQRVELVAPTW